MDLGSEISKQIKASIKTKLQDLGSYVDDELPEYIMVMLSNRRGKKQMTEDLMLFLGENTVKFIDWLTSLVEKLKDVASLVDDDEPEKAAIAQEIPIITPEKEPTPSKHEKEPVSRKSVSREKRKSPSKSTSKDSSSSHSKSSKSASSKSEKSKGRHGSSESKHSHSKKRKLSESDEEVSSVNPPISSVVKVQEKRPSLPPSKQATSSLLRKAVAEAHMSVTKVMHNLTYDPTSPPSPIKVQSLEEKQQQKELLLQQHRELQKQLETKELEQSINEAQTENGYFQDTEKEVTETEQKTQETSKTESNFINEPVIELQVTEAEALELNAELVSKGDTRIVAFADSQTATTEPEEDKHKRKRKRAVKSRDRPKSPKFIVTLDGVDSELEDKFEKHSKHKETPKKPKSEFDDYVEIDTSNMPIAQQTESTPERATPPAVEQVMFRLDNGSDDEEMLQMSVVSRPPEKCKFWPDCMNGPNCPFYHPSTPCRTFPNCKFADKCLFIHPLCKFDDRCANTSCPYLHKNKLKTKPPTLIKPALQLQSPQPPVPKVDEALPTLAQITPCKFYPGCTRVNCPFLHPKPTVTKVCRYGSSCSRADCMFTHPPDKSALKWVAPSLHISERSFALPEGNVKKMPIAF